MKKGTIIPFSNEPKETLHFTQKQLEQFLEFRRLKSQSIHPTEVQFYDNELQSMMEIGRIQRDSGVVLDLYNGEKEAQLTKKQGKWRVRVQGWFRKRKRKTNQEEPSPSFVNRWLKRHEELIEKQLELYEVEDEQNKE